MFNQVTPLNRRAMGRQLLASAVLLSTVNMANANSVGWFPSLEDLEPRWNQVGEGMSPDQVVLLMATAPTAREQSELIGLLRVEELFWRDMRKQYRARFFNNKLYYKSLTPNTNSLFGRNSAGLVPATGQA